MLKLKGWHDDLGEGSIMASFLTGLKDVQIVGKALFSGVSAKVFPEEVSI